MQHAKTNDVAFMLSWFKVQELNHVKQCLAAEKQSNGELAEAIRRHRRAAAKQDAEAAGREHKHQDEVQELKKV